MEDQLSMFSNEAVTEKPVKDEALSVDSTDTEYEALDNYLADLMVELNSYKPDDEQEKKALNKTLRACTLEISKRTREGQIAYQISTAQKSILLSSTVAGEASDYMPLIIDDKHEGTYLYLNRYWQYQQHLAEQINTRIIAKETLSDAQLTWAQTRLADYFPEDENSKEINWQKRAAELALQNKFLIVSGGPGTGKTTTITRILALLIEQQVKEKSEQKVGGVLPHSFNILLAAPTGKAAIRMLDSIRDASQSLDKDIYVQMPTHASTLHKLLGYKPNSTQFKHHRNNPLNADVVLVDEASMIDIALMSKLVDAVPEHAKLILIGDKDQLASVETGSVFADMCLGLENKTAEDRDESSSSIVTLKKNWRFDADSDIGQCAIAANEGDSKTLLSILNDSNRLDAERIKPSNLRDADLIKPWRNYFKVLNNPDSSLQAIFDAFNEYRVLCALRRGLNGSEMMSTRIETALEKQGLITRRHGYLQNKNQQSNWYHGRPVMITQNSYSRDLFNGDTGITLIRDDEINVVFPDSSENQNSNETGFKSFSPVRLPAHETTWAMTIHKSQGSEFNQVLLILPQEEMPLLTRQLVYTGITRAKESVSIIASEDVLTAGVRAEVVGATRISQKLKKG